MKKCLTDMSISERVKRLRNSLIILKLEKKNIKFIYKNYIKVLENNLENAVNLKLKENIFLTNLFRFSNEKIYKTN